MEYNLISFPNISEKSLKVSRVAFSIFSKEIYWYAIILTTGIIVASLYALWRSKKSENINSDAMTDFIIVGVILGIIGSRAYYVLTTLDDYDSFLDMIAVWRGGLAFYGALIGGIIGIIIVALVKKVNVFKMFDICAPGVIIAQAIGRWGNFVNGEAYGSTKTFEFLSMKCNVDGFSKLPWLMQIDKYSDDKLLSTVLCQPTFLYESIWCLIGFIILHCVYKKKKFDGQIFFAYLSWYGFGRMLIESLRTDSLYVGSIKISQLVGLLCFVFGLFFVIFGKKFFKLQSDIPEKCRVGYNPKTKKLEEANKKIEEVINEDIDIDNTVTEETEDKENKEENSNG